MSKSQADSAPPGASDGVNLDRLRERFDLSLALSSDEVAELTERVLETRRVLDDKDTSLISLGSFVRILEPHQLSEEVIDGAIDGLLRSREQRLSNAIANKAHELERMLLGLLPRLDSFYQSNLSLEIPSGRAAMAGAEVNFRVRSKPGRFEVEVRHQIPGGVSERLFTIVVRGARKARMWERILERRPANIAKEVVVRAPLFSGTTLNDLLTWALLEKNAGTDRGVTAAFAMEKLHSAIMDGIEAALQFVNRLKFDAEATTESKAVSG